MWAHVDSTYRRARARPMGVRRGDGVRAAAQDAHERRGRRVHLARRVAAQVERRARARASARAGRVASRAACLGYPAPRRPRARHPAPAHAARVCGRRRGAAHVLDAAHAAPRLAAVPRLSRAQLVRTAQQPTRHTVAAPPHDTAHGRARRGRRAGGRRAGAHRTADARARARRIYAAAPTCAGARRRRGAPRAAPAVARELDGRPAAAQRLGHAQHDHAGRAGRRRSRRDGPGVGAGRAVVARDAAAHAAARGAHTPAHSDAHRLDTAAPRSAHDRAVRAARDAGAGAAAKRPGRVAQHADTHAARGARRDTQRRGARDAERHGAGDAARDAERSRAIACDTERRGALHARDAEPVRPLARRARAHCAAQVATQGTRCARGARGARGARAIGTARAPARFPRSRSSVRRRPAGAAARADTLAYPGARVAACCVGDTAACVLPTSAVIRGHAHVHRLFACAAGRVAR